MYTYVSAIKIIIIFWLIYLQKVSLFNLNLPFVQLFLAK